MFLRKATSKVPEKDNDIEENVMYIGKRDYVLNGRYRMFINGDAKINGKKTPEGVYQGAAEDLVLTVGASGGVCFDRFPYPIKKGIVPASVAPVINYINIEDRMRNQIMDMEQRLRDERKTEKELEDDLRQAIDYLQSDESYDPDLYVDEDYGVVSLEEVQAGVDSAPVEQPTSPINQGEANPEPAEGEKGEEVGVAGSSPPQALTGP